MLAPLLILNTSQLMGDFSDKLRGALGEQADADENVQSSETETKRTARLKDGTEVKIGDRVRIMWKDKSPSHPQYMEATITGISSDEHPYTALITDQEIEEETLRINPLTPYAEVTLLK